MGAFKVLIIDVLWRNSTWELTTRHWHWRDWSGSAWAWAWPRSWSCDGCGGSEPSTPSASESFWSTEINQMFLGLFCLFQIMNSASFGTWILFGVFKKILELQPREHLVWSLSWTCDPSRRRWRCWRWSWAPAGSGITRSHTTTCKTNIMIGLEECATSKTLRICILDKQSKGV